MISYLINNLSINLQTPSKSCWHSIGVFFVLWKIFVDFRHNSRSCCRWPILRYVCHDHWRWVIELEKLFT